MAGKKKTKAKVSRSGGVVVVQPPPPVRASGGGVTRRRSRSRRRSSVGGGNYGTKQTMIGAGVGGFAVGFIEKQWGAQLPNLPFIGRKGALALGAYFLAPKNKLFRDVGIAAAAVAGYELGKTGTVSGDDGYDDDMVST